MAGFLKLSLRLMVHTAGSETRHPCLDGNVRTEFERDPFHVFRVEATLLMRKARHYVIAALVANRDSNLHSLAVQMRPALECAGFPSRRARGSSWRPSFLLWKRTEARTISPQDRRGDYL